MKWILIEIKPDGEKRPVPFTLDDYDDACELQEAYEGFNPASAYLIYTEDEWIREGRA
jgi:hypothetical protein